MTKLCQGPSCHMYDTTDRKRGPKGNKRNITRTVGHYSYGNNNFCTLTCYNDWASEHRPLTEAQYNDSTYTLNTGE